MHCTKFVCFVSLNALCDLAVRLLFPQKLMCFSFLQFFAIVSAPVSVKSGQQPASRCVISLQWVPTADKKVSVKFLQASTDRKLRPGYLSAKQHIAVSVTVRSESNVAFLISSQYRAIAYIDTSVNL